METETDATNNHPATLPELPPAQPENGESRFPIVGIGASAGGLEAFTQLLSGIPNDSGMAYVLVQHLDPTHESQLRELLARDAHLPILDVTDGLQIKPDHVYVIPPNKSLLVRQGTLRLTPREPGRGGHHTIDDFLKSLAADRQSMAIGVILSGSGTDGAAGLTEIKSGGGITFAQDEATSKHTGMPRTAANSGSVDFILSPAQIAEELVRIGRHAYLQPARDDGPPIAGQDAFPEVLALLWSGTGVDFSEYRETTIRRRMARRMALCRIDDLPGYIDYLKTNPEEVPALYRDILINVTSFFRDPALFDVLKARVLPEILKNKTAETPVRMWTAGCSTGQEAYSLAITLLEYYDSISIRPPIQIFATDITDNGVMDTARAGFYPEGIEADVSPERLRRFFTREDGGYRIRKSIRDLCVFAKQNVGTDPPFSRVDLISCRNLLIYLSNNLQQRILPTFHYALNMPGFLLLGASETIGRFSDLFSVVDRDVRVYSKSATVTRTLPSFAPRTPIARLMEGGDGAAARVPTAAELQREADRILLGRYAPAGVLVNTELEILQFRGKTGPYLEPGAGTASLNLLKMARENLFIAIRNTIDEARATGILARRDDVPLRDHTGARTISVEVIPLRTPAAIQAGFLVLFQEPDAAGAPAVRPETTSQQPPLSQTQIERELAQARLELSATREYLQTLIEQHAGANEELKSANEEILSSNEELQSTNEELQTAKEELQSTNEELATVNEELQNRNGELTHANDDQINLLASMKIPILMVGTDLLIRRFTPAAGKVLRLIPTDVGRPINVIRFPMNIPDLESWISDVISSISPREREVQDNEGRWYLVRVHPYLTSDNRIDGALVVFVDINDVRRAQEELKTSRDLAMAIVETTTQPLLILDGELRVQTANRAFYDTFHTTADVTLGRQISDLASGVWGGSTLRQLLEKVVPSGSTFSEFEVTRDFPDMGRRTIVLNARRLASSRNSTPLILLAFEDVTARRQADQQRASIAEMKAAAEAKDQFFAVLSHELRTPLTPVLLAASSLHMRPDLPEDVRDQLGVMCGDIQMEARLIDDLLDLTRISRGKMAMEMRPMDLRVPLAHAVRICRPDLVAKGLDLHVDVSPKCPWIIGDTTRIQQAIWNLLRNAIKFTPKPGWIKVRCYNQKSKVVIEVADSGIGIDADTLPRLFVAFEQGGQVQARRLGGLGLGLVIAKAIVELHDGNIRGSSPGINRGSVFAIELAADPALEKAARDLIQPNAAAPGVTETGDRTLRILLVEDHVPTRVLMERLLRDWGHQVEVADCIATAKQAAAHGTYDLVLSDLGLPDGNGAELMAFLRDNFGLKGIALTGFGMEEDRAKTQAAGFYAHLVKPIEVGRLHEVITAAPK